MLNATVSARRQLVCNHGRRLNLFRRAFIGQTINQPISPIPQPTTTSEDGTQRLRARGHGGRSLPLPPVMDIVAVEAKDKYKKAKSWKQEEDVKSSFTERMEMNAFAQALASPIRQCQLTNARLPSHFLLPIVGAVKTTQDDTGGTKRQASLTLALLNAEAESQRSLTRSYILNKYSALNFVTKRKKWPQIMQERMRKWLEARSGRSLQHARDVQKHVSWDPDMAACTRTKLQQDVIKHLRNGIYHKYVVDARDLAHQETEQLTQEVALILNLYENSQLPPPGSWQAAKGNYVLWELLETDPPELDEMTMSKDSTTRVGDVPWLVVKRDKRALPLHLALMKLESFLEYQNSNFVMPELPWE